MATNREAHSLPQQGSAKVNTYIPISPGRQRNHRNQLHWLNTAKSTGTTTNEILAEPDVHSRDFMRGFRVPQLRCLWFTKLMELDPDVAWGHDLRRPTAQPRDGKRLTIIRDSRKREVRIPATNRTNGSTQAWNEEQLQRGVHPPTDPIQPTSFPAAHNRKPTAMGSTFYAARCLGTHRYLQPPFGSTARLFA